MTGKEKNKFLEQADAIIARLKDKVLPYTPHLLIVQESGNSRLWNPSELRGMPFEEHEIKHLQYMTMVTHGDRGIARPRGDWQDMIDSRSPSAAARSTASTPNPAKDSKIPKTKVSLAEYARMKKEGYKPSPRPVSAEDGKPGHSRNTSQVSSEPMSRGPSFEGAFEDRQNSRGIEKPQPSARPNGANVSANQNAASHMAAKNIDQKPATSTSRHADTNTKPATTNGTTPKPLPSHHPNRSSQILKPTQPLKHPLPPRPQSPQSRNGEFKRNTTEPKQQKRTLELSESTHTEKRASTTPQKRPLDSKEAVHSTEKRAKVEHTHTPSNPQKSTLSKPETSTQHKGSPSLANQPSAKQSQTSSLQRKEAPKPIVTNTGSHSSSQKPVDLPPLLSPLPADLDHSPGSPQRGSEHGMKPKSKVSSSHNTPSKSTISSDTIVVKDVAKKASHVSHLSFLDTSSPLSSRSSTPPFVLPPLLSPGLPPVVEKELNRLHEKAKYESLQSRNEKVRRAGAPGVAQKMPKIGHPPKKRRSSAELSEAKAESSKTDIKSKTNSDDKKFISDGGTILRLKYKKSRAKDIQRILQMRQRPTASRPFEEQRTGNEKNEEKGKSKAVESDEDAPSIKIAHYPSAAISKKHASDSFGTPEPAPKRLKPSIDIVKAKAPVEPAFKSPAPSAAPKKDLLTTPKKSDTLKSTAMRKIPSTDSHAHTPQATSSSTPASAEKPRINGESSKRPIDASKYLGENGQGRLAKREMDRLLKPYVAKMPESTEPDFMIGLCRGLECLVAYNTGFSLSGQQKAPKHRANDWESAVMLWDFVCKRATRVPALFHLCWQIGALFKEELARNYTTMLGELKDGDGAKGLIEKLALNAKSKDKCWLNTQHFRKAVIELGIEKRVLGPWSNEKDAREYIMTVLEEFSKKENLGWKKMFDE